MQEKEYFWRPWKNLKKIVCEEETDCESETWEGQHVSKGGFVEQEKKKNKNNLKTKEKIKYLII